MEQNIKELEASLKGLTAYLSDELKGIRTNRPSVELIESIKVNYFDDWLTIQQLGSISVVPPREIRISVWDKNATGPITKAIEDANAGLTVSVDGTAIRATLSQMSNERREEFMKIAKKKAESTRIEIRGKRDETMMRMKAMQDSGGITEDQAFKGKERIQKVVDGENKRVEALLEEKLRELEE